MEVVFLSNYFNHHHNELCDGLFEITNGRFWFAETGSMSEARKNLGWENSDNPTYVCNVNDCLRQIYSADFVIWGDAPFCYIKKRLVAGKVVFRYSERLFKKGLNPINYTIQLFRGLYRYKPFINEYLLCASGFAYDDFRKIFCFKKKAFKWGYFPPSKNIQWEDRHYHISKNQTVNILWVGRFIDWKHPEIMLELADLLNKDGYNFDMKIIGNGSMRDILETEISRKKYINVSIDGPISAGEVRTVMEDTDIFISTSDYNEGWGAVINEAMNSGCAVVVSDAVGSAPYLVSNGNNGLIFRNCDVHDLYKKTTFLLENKGEIPRLGKNAYDSIAKLWNGQLAAKRLVELYHSLCKNKQNVFLDGPCSNA